MKHVIVWGAAGGIGRAVCEELAGDGDTVVAVARDASDLASITRYTVDANLADEASVAQAVLQATAVTEAFDLFVFAAGDITSAKVPEMPLTTWHRILDNNLTAAFLTVQASLPYLAPGAPIVLLGAVHERLRLPGLAAYASAKVALEAFADVVRKETRRRVLVIRPGAVQTPLWKKVPFAMPKQAADAHHVAKQIVGAVAEGRDGVIDL